MNRNAFFDNAKIILITLVVFGHLIQPFTSESSSIQTLYTWIYTFHMPAFIFIAGYFAKGSGNPSYIGNLAKKLIIPYIIFQLIYTAYYFLIGKSNWLTDSIFYPHWSLWFLFSLFCWHIMLIVYRRIPWKYGILLAICIGVGIGYFNQVGHLFSLSRTFVFFPYFLIGYWTTKQQIYRVKGSGVKFIAFFVLAISLWFIHYLPNIHTGWLLASKSYGVLGEETYGGIIRFIVYVTSIVMSISVLALIPERRFSFTELGERTLYVYLLHGFFIQLFRRFDFFQLNHVLDLIGLVLVSIVIVYLLSSKVVVSLWQPFIEGSASRLRRFLRSREIDHRI